MQPIDENRNYDFNYLGQNLSLKTKRRVHKLKAVVLGVLLYGWLPSGTLSDAWRSSTIDVSKQSSGRNTSVVYKLLSNLEWRTEQFGMEESMEDLITQKDD